MVRFTPALRFLLSQQAKWRGGLFFEDTTPAARCVDSSTNC
jgi:hypothetical protein